MSLNLKKCMYGSEEVNITIQKRNKTFINSGLLHGFAALALVLE
jgi:hypothetical protein